MVQSILCTMAPPSHPPCIALKFSLLLLAPLLLTALLSSCAAASAASAIEPELTNLLYTIHSSLPSQGDATWDGARGGGDPTAPSHVSRALQVHHVSRPHAGYGTGMHNAQGRASNDRPLGLTGSLSLINSAGAGGRGRSAMALLKVAPIVRRGCTVLVGGPTGFKTVQAALARIGPNSGVARKTVCILPGVYRENVVVQAGQNGITLRGSGMANTKIIAARAQTAFDTDPLEFGTLIVKGGGFRAENLTIENAHKNITIPSPAVAIMGEFSSWEKVAFVAWDDTLGIQTSRHVFKDCLVAGLTDMIWGFGRGAFVNTVIFVRFYYDPLVVYTGHIATFGTDTAFGTSTVAGATFYNCTVTGPGLVALGQAYRPLVMVTYIHCKLGANVVGHGWNNLFNMYRPAQTMFREYGSTGPGARAVGRTYGTVARGPVPLSLQLENYIGPQLFSQEQLLSQLFHNSPSFSTPAKGGAVGGVAVVPGRRTIGPPITTPVVTGQPGQTAGNAKPGSAGAGKPGGTTTTGSY